MGTEHSVFASSFADPDDIRRFKACKAKGKSDQECFKVGDNGIGCWGDDVSEGTGPSCALPPEVMEFYWGSVEGAKHKQIVVRRYDKKAVVTIKDRMPHLKNLANAARIDLNPDACKALDIPIPAMHKVIWRKIEDGE